MLTGDERMLDELINDYGVDQLTASRIVWAPHMADVPIEPRSDAPLRDQLAWAGARARQIVREGLNDVLRWLGITSDPLALYRAAKGRGGDPA